MRKAMIVGALCLAGLAIAVTAVAASGPPGRTPDAKAVPQLGKARVTLLQGIKKVKPKYGRVVEAKFELDDSGALSLSTYTAPRGYDVFDEVSGPAAATSWKPSPEVIKEREDLVNATFDLTIMQQGRIDLATAVQRATAEQAGVVYWAVPTIHGKQPEIGVYIRSSDGKSHHLFIPVT